MMATAPPPPDVAAAVAGWIHRLVCLRDDTALYGLDRRGIAAALDDVTDDMQRLRQRVES